MHWNGWVRQVHRWLSLGFATAVVIYVVAMMRGRPAGWLGLLPLMSLMSLISLGLTGLYLFVLPYAAGRPARRGVGGRFVSRGGADGSGAGN